jgi:hypothetical protein
MDTKNARRLFLLFLLIAFVMLFFVSPDSYTHDVFGRGDSAWFFLCGKAWMNGMTPYVDFSDSKGPLLWFIYGIGYLISHYDYIGVFWLSCLFYAVTYYYIYKTASLFVKDSRIAVMCTIVMSVAFFNPFIHYEIRCEDFCLTFLVLSLYRTSLLLYGDKTDMRTATKTSVIFGFCFGAILLIKFNIAAILFVFFCYILYESHTRRYGIMRQLLFMLAGFALITIPFVICFLIEGNLSAFIYEYFIRTVLTTSNIPSASGLRHVGLITEEIINPVVISLFLLTTIGTALMATELHRYRYFPIISCIFAFFIAAQNAAGPHYFSSCSPWLVFILLWLSIHFRHIATIWRIPVSVSAILLCIAANTMMKDKIGNFFYQDNDRNLSTVSECVNRKDFYDYVYVMSQVRNPRVVYLDYMRGIGVTVHDLPACRYFCKQLGETAEMEDFRWKACMQRIPDFIITADGMTDKVHRLLTIGYHLYRFGDSKHLCLLSKRILGMPPSDFHLTNMDILLKRRIHFRGSFL